MQCLNSKPSVCFLRLFSVDVIFLHKWNLFEPWIFDIDKFSDFLSGAWLLLAELVAWEAKELESLILEFCVNLNKLRVVQLSNASL